jgi:D-glycero-alpha-D-manno-heptose-7-phosphate kinase
MLIARTPLRIPLGGGLTDLASYAQRFGGVTVSATIAQAAYVTLLPSLDGRFEVVAEGRVETAARLSDVRHDLVREALRSVDPEHPPLRLAVWVDVAGQSGLGTSGAVTVTLLHALRAYRGEHPTAEALATEAARIEVDVLQGASGYHDPHVCARGGLLRLDYDGPRVTARPLVLRDADRARFEGSLLLFASGRQARTKPSLDLLSSHLEEALPILHDLKALALELVAALERGDLLAVAFCIGEKQRLKERLPGHFVDDYVRDVTARVRATGAAPQLPGGKISGYVLVCCPDGQQAAVRAALADHREVPLTLSRGGTSALRVTATASLAGEDGAR